MYQCGPMPVSGIDNTMLASSVVLPVLLSGGVVRYYFNLTDGDAVIRDEEGVEVSSIQSALMAAMEIIEELRAEDPSTAGEWQGWRLEIVDSCGRVVHSMVLDDLSIH